MATEENMLNVKEVAFSKAVSLVQGPFVSKLPFMSATI